MFLFSVGICSPLKQYQNCIFRVLHQWGGGSKLISFTQISLGFFGDNFVLSLPKDILDKHADPLILYLLF